MNKNNLLTINQLEQDLIQQLVNKLMLDANFIKKNTQEFLKFTSEKILRWTLLLAQKQITLSEFEWLLKAQVNLLKIKHIENNAITSTKINKFKEQLVQIIINLFITKYLKHA